MLHAVYTKCFCKSRAIISSDTQVNKPYDNPSGLNEAISTRWQNKTFPHPPWVLLRVQICNKVCWNWISTQLLNEFLYSTHPCSAFSQLNLFYGMKNTERTACQVFIYHPLELNIVYIQYCSYKQCLLHTKLGLLVGRTRHTQNYIEYIGM